MVGTVDAAVGQYAQAVNWMSDAERTECNRCWDRSKTEQGWDVLANDEYSILNRVTMVTEGDSARYLQF